METGMTIDNLRRAFLVFTMLAVSSIAPTVGPARMAIAKPAIRLDARTHRLDGMPALRSPTAQPKDAANDPFASLHLE